MSNILVEFKDNGTVRIHKDEQIIADKKDQLNVLLNPNVSHLVGISPSFWKRVGNAVEKMTEEEIMSLKSKLILPIINESTLIKQKIEEKADNFQEIYDKMDASFNIHAKRIENIKNEAKTDIDEVYTLIKNLNNTLYTEFNQQYQNVIEQIKKNHNILTTRLYRILFTSIFIDILAICYIIYQRMQ